MSQFRSGTLGALVIALLVTAASAWMAFGSNAIYCDRLAQMTVLATLAAFVIALSFRLLARAASSLRKWQLAAALTLAAVTLFGDASFVVKYRGICRQLEKQVRQVKAPPAN